MGLWCTESEEALWYQSSVPITYNEDSNGIMTVTRGASQLRGSELFYIGNCFQGTDQCV